MALSALALDFDACCVAPWAVALLGVSGAVMLARLAGLQSLAVAVTLRLGGVGFWYAYRTRSGAKGWGRPIEDRKGRWLICRPDAVCSGAAPPKLGLLMDQLSGLPQLSQFRWLNGRAFAARVHAMVADLDRPAASQ